MSDAASSPSLAMAGFQRALHSFRFRLTLLFVAILAAILAGFSVFIYISQARNLYAETANRLAAQSLQLADYYNSQIRALDEKNEEHPSSISGGELPLLPENTVLALLGRDERVVLQQTSVQPGVLAALIETWSKSHAILEPLTFTLPGEKAQGKANGVEYLFEVSPLETEGRRVGYLLLASPVDPESQLERLAVSLAVGSFLILSFAFVGGYWLADRAMKPVQTIVHTARTISESDLSRRINLQRHDELGELADTFDQMLDRLQAAFERQRQFTADASHELRSPLAIIELEAERALERPRKPDEYEKTLRLIQSENGWMSRLVNDLLLLARMDSGQTAKHTERLDLSEVVVEVTERLYPLARARGAIISTGSLAEYYVQAERVYLTQLLTNLVENAIKYGGGEGAQVLVETASQTVDNRQWSLVRITDNGPGIPAEHLPYIFDRFYRTDMARTRSGEDDDVQASGSGLGLAIAKSIVEAYDGKIEVSSQAGKGTTFTVLLPAV